MCVRACTCRPIPGQLDSQGEGLVGIREAGEGIQGAGDGVQAGQAVDSRLQVAPAHVGGQRAQRGDVLRDAPAGRAAAVEAGPEAGAAPLHYLPHPAQPQLKLGLVSMLQPAFHLGKFKDKLASEAAVMRCMPIAGVYCS